MELDFIGTSDLSTWSVRSRYVHPNAKRILSFHSKEISLFKIKVQESIFLKVLKTTVTAKKYNQCFESIL
jgi:hypothetical protein